MKKLQGNHFQISLLILISFSFFYSVFAQFPVKKTLDNSRVLVVNETIEREISGGEIHLYRISLKKGEFLRVTVLQIGIDLTVKLSGAGGKQILESDSYNSTNGPESISFEAAATNEYGLEISSFKNEWTQSRYTISLDVNPSVSATDRQKISAENLMREAKALFKLKTKEERLPSIAKLETASAIWQKLGDSYWLAQVTQTIGYYKLELISAESGLENYQTALQMWRNLGERFGECQTMDDIGYVFYSKDEGEKAAKQYREAARICGEAGDKYFEGRAYNNAGNTYFYKLKNYEQAIESYEKALPVFRLLGDREQEAVILNALGASNVRLKKDEQAVPLYEAALALEQKLGRAGRETLVLNNLGDVYYFQSNFVKALEYYERALPKSRESKETESIGKTLVNLAETNSNLNRRDEAVKFHIEAALIYRAVSNKIKEAEALDSVGIIYYEQDKYSKSLEYHKAAVALLAPTDKTDLAGRLFYNLGDDYYRLNNPKQALVNYQIALPIQQKLGNELEQANCLNKIAEMLYLLNHYQESLSFYDKAIDLYKKLGNRGGEADGLNGIARILDFTGEPKKAIDFYSRALLIWREIKDQESEALTLNELGTVYVSIDDRQTAASYFEQSLKIARKNEYQEREADVLNSIAGIYSFQNDSEKALENFNRALEIYRNIENQRGVAEQIIGIGRVYEKDDDYEKAILNYSEALKIHEKIDHQPGISMVFSNLGDVYKTLKLNDRALEYYQRALQIDRQTENKNGITRSLLDIAAIHYSLSEYEKTLENCRLVLPIVRDELNDQTAESRTLNLMALVYDSLGDRRGEPRKKEYLEKATDYFKQSIEIDRQVGNQSGAATKLMNLGTNYFFRDEYSIAIDYFNQSLVLRKKLKGESGIALTLYWMARMKKYQNDYVAACRYIEEAISQLEGIRSKIKDDELRTTYFASVQNYYELYIDALMQLHKQQPEANFSAKALEMSERARARVLLELLAESRIDIRQGVDIPLVEREKSLQVLIENLMQAQVRVPENQSERREKLVGEIGNLKQDLQTVRKEIKAKSPAYAALTQPKPLDLNEIQNKLLDEDTVLLEYSLSAPRSYLWLVGKNSLESFELPARSEIEKLARQAHAMFSISQRFNRGDGKKKRDAIVDIVGEKASFETLQELSRILLAPVTKQINGKRLLIVADGALQYLPFSALPQLSKKDTPSNARKYEPMVLSNEIITLPSASTLSVLRQETAVRNPASKILTVLADPVFSASDKRLAKEIQEISTRSKPKKNADRKDALTIAGRQYERAVKQTRGNSLPRLEGTLAEALSLKDLITNSDDFRSFLNFDANRENALLPDLKKYRYVHFATHGLLNTVQPELSGIALSMVNKKGEAKDGFLRLGDVFNLDLPAEMVVLSACQTGLGKDVKGEGIIGLTRGFMYAGARRVVVSLWSIDDDGTSEFMTRFYKLILREGKPPAEALREAQKLMFTDKNNKRFNSPYYWAAFTLQGEWN